jgi:hypothetical protein
MSGLLKVYLTGPPAKMLRILDTSDGYHHPTCCACISGRAQQVSHNSLVSQIIFHGFITMEIIIGDRAAHQETRAGPGKKRDSYFGPSDDR